MNQQPLTVHQILTTISESPKSGPYKLIANRVEFLKKHESFELKSVLQGAFNEKIKFDLPPGNPPEYKKGTPVPFKTSISEFAKLLQEKKSFVREGTFLKILSRCTDDEAKILIAIKDKTLTELYRGIYPAVAELAFPKLFGK